jgi:hypothetical protein
MIIFNKRSIKIAKNILQTLSPFIRPQLAKFEQSLLITVDVFRLLLVDECKWSTTDSSILLIPFIMITGKP